MLLYMRQSFLCVNIVKAFCWFRFRLSQPPTVCPVTAIHHYFQLVPADVNLPFFLRTLKVPTSAHRIPPFLQLYQRNITATGLDATNFSLRSLVLRVSHLTAPWIMMMRDPGNEVAVRVVFRRGGATLAYQSGVPDHLIKLHALIPNSKIVLTPIVTSNPLPPFPPYHLAWHWFEGWITFARTQWHAETESTILKN